MRTTGFALLAAAAMLPGCNQSQPQNSAQAEPTIKVKGPEQQQMHQLDALNLAIALKRAIYDSGYTCKRIDKEGYVADYKNLEMWTAHCVDGRDWAIFVGADGSAQVRDCVDVPRFGLPKCEISQAPKGTLAPAVASNKAAAK